MSALSERDLNRSITAQPANEQKSKASGEENKSQDSQEMRQHKQVLEQKIAENNGYVVAAEHHNMDGVLIETLQQAGSKLHQPIGCDFESCKLETGQHETEADGETVCDSSNYGRFNDPDCNNG